MGRELAFLGGVAGDVGVDGIISQNEPKLGLVRVRTWVGGWAGGDGDFFDFDLGGFGVAALGLDLAELFEGAVELAGESRFVHAEGGEGAGLLGEAVGEEAGFEGGDAIQAPCGVGEGLDELLFESAEGLEVGEEALEVELELGGVLGGQEGGAAGEWSEPQK